MLSYEDCLAFCRLTQAEIEAIAEHEHIPQIVAAEFGNYLLAAPDGGMRIRRIILDDIAAARARGDTAHALALKLILSEFVKRYPPKGKKAVHDSEDHSP